MILEALFGQYLSKLLELCWKLKVTRSHWNMTSILRRIWMSFTEKSVGQPKTQLNVDVLFVVLYWKLVIFKLLDG